MTLHKLIADYPFVVAMAVVYLAAFLTAAPSLLLRRERIARLSVLILGIGFALNTVAIVDRWVEAGRPPFKTLFETLLLYPWCISLLALALIWAHRLRLLVVFAAAFNLVGLAYGLSRPDVEIVHLPPALQSVWFIPHVVIYFIAYAALALAAGLAAVTLLAPAWERVRHGAPNGNGNADGFRAKVERTAHHAAAFGIVTLTLGLVMGAVWGKYAWGDYWSWDPKENWSLVTWLGYMAYAHVHLVPRWRRQALWLLIVAFGAVLFTYLGMHLLPTAGSSLHVYQ